MPSFSIREASPEDMRAKRAGSEEFKSFVLALKGMKPGQALVIQKLPSNYYNAIATAELLLDVEFRSKKTRGGGYSIVKIR